MTAIPCSALTRAGRPCHAWAVRGTHPPLCMAHAQQQVRAVPATDARQVLPAARQALPAPPAEPATGPAGFYAPCLRPDEVGDLVILADDLTLRDEIALVRVALRRLLEALAQDREDAPQPSAQRLDVGRVALLVFQGSRTVARLLREQQALSTGSFDAVLTVMDLALDELGVRWELTL